MKPNHKWMIENFVMEEKRKQEVHKKKEKGKKTCLPHDSFINIQTISKRSNRSIQLSLRLDL